MVKEQLFILGPVLSYRGATPNGNNQDWRVTALIGIRKTAPIPRFQVEGTNCPDPVLLYEDNKGRYFRYDLTRPLQDQERMVEFGISADGPNWHFTIPGANYAPRMAYVSCNGFSSPSGMRKLIRPANAVWEDLLSNHDRSLRPENYALDKEQIWHEDRTHNKNLQRFHLLLMGGDQIYFDSIWEDLRELKDWIALSRQEQLDFKVTTALRRRIETYYFGLYSERWLPPSRGAWDSQRKTVDGSDAMARIPTIMMWDDHDIFDGWGSYTPQMQQSDLFQTLFACARRAFWVFQLQHALGDLPPLEYAYDSRVSRDDPLFKPVPWSVQLSNDTLALPLFDQQPGFSFGLQVGPVSVLVADLRTERSRNQILSQATWQTLQKWLQKIPARPPGGGANGCQHLLVLSSVPVAHPKLTLAEAAFDIFDYDHVLDSNADDLRDHWSHDDHEGERKRLIETLTKCAKDKKLRIEILSGDVHVAAWGTIYRKDVPPSSNWAQLQQFTSSAVIHPSLTGVFEKLFLAFLNNTATNVQSIDVEHDVQMMLFPGHNRHMMAARNWLALELDSGKGNPNGSKLWATWRCENKDGFSNHLLAVHPAEL